MGNLEGKSDNSMGSDKESVGLGNQDNSMEKTNLDKIYHEGNLINSVGCLQKNHTKKSIYDDYPSLHTVVIPINSHFSTKDIISSFEMYNGVDVAADNIPLDWLKIPGKQKYFFRQTMFQLQNWLPSMKNARRNSRNVRITPSLVAKDKINTISLLLWFIWLTPYNCSSVMSKLDPF